MRIKNFLRKSRIVTGLWSVIRKYRDRDVFCKRAKVINLGYGTIEKVIKGSNNAIIIGRNVRTDGTMFRIIGHNNTIQISDDCVIGPDCSFWLEGNNINIKVGAHTSFTRLCHVNAQEDGSSIEIGEGCMFSNHIIVRTSDSHPIYDMESFQRINCAKPVRIGNQVWIAPDSKIMKGANIGDGSIIGSNTMVGKYIPPHSLAVGMPARIVKSNVFWTREDVIFNKKKEKPSYN